MLLMQGKDVADAVADERIQRIKTNFSGKRSIVTASDQVAIGRV